MTDVDVTLTNSGRRVRVELHSDLERDWFDSVVDDYVALGGGVYLVDEELGQALAEAMLEHGMTVKATARIPRSGGCRRYRRG